MAYWTLEDGTLGGGVKKFANLAFLKVLNAGHMVPMDQPQVALAMIEEFITTKTLGTETHARPTPLVQDDDEEFDIL